MKKLLFVLILLFTITLLNSCNGYFNSYSATIMLTSSFGDEASMEFKTFKGTYNFKLKREGDPEHSLDIDASLGEGFMNIYIGVNGEKELICTIKGGESIDKIIALDSKYNNQKTIYVILESNGLCMDGDFEFEYN